MSMAGSGGLIELVLVFAFLLGWGFLELRGLRLDKKKAEEAAAEKERQIAGGEDPAA